MGTEEATLLGGPTTTSALVAAWTQDDCGQRLGPYSAQEAADRVRLIAAALQRRAAVAHPRPTSRPVIAYSTPPGVDGALLFLASSIAGVAAPLRPTLTPTELESSLDLITPDLHLPAHPGVVDDLLADGALEVELPAPRDLALILTTSGTTGPPKRVGLDHARLSGSALNIARWFDLSPADHALTVMPLFHIHGLVAGVLAPLAGRGSVTPTPFDPFGFGTTIAEIQPTWCSAVPSMWELVLRRWRERRDDLTNAPWRFLRTSSSALPPSLKQELEEIFGVPVLEAYGMTEAAHQITANPLPPGVATAGSVGVPTGQTRVRIVEPNHDGEGSIQIAGPTIIAEYLDGQSSASFSDGWFSTGDEGVIDAEGRLFITGRTSEFINRGGDKISPREIEEALVKHPAVDRAVAFPVAHEVLGQVPGAAVVLHPGAIIDAPALKGHLVSLLSRPKRPDRIDIVEDWPLGPTGKLQRRFLAQQLGWV